MSQPISLSSLAPREAIADALHRSVIAFDINDEKMLASSLTLDATFSMMGVTHDGYDAIKTNILDNVGPLDTTHFISNVRVNYEEGSKTAYMTAYAQAQHYRKGEGIQTDAKNLLSGSMYFLDLVKEGELWKIKKWDMKLTWLQGDASIVMGGS